MYDLRLGSQAMVIEVMLTGELLSVLSSKRVDHTI
nr:MAG TPA: hypothetical protein [Caudoviricetes sp.]